MFRPLFRCATIVAASGILAITMGVCRAIGLFLSPMNSAMGLAAQAARVGYRSAQPRWL